MFDLKKRSSLTLNSSLEAEEFRRQAVRRKVKGGAAADGDASHTGEAQPPKPDHLQGPLRAEGQSPAAGKRAQRVCASEQHRSPDRGSVSSVSLAPKGQSSPSPAREAGSSFVNGLSGAFISPNGPAWRIQSLPSSPNVGSPSPSKGGVHGFGPLKEGGRSPAKLSPRNLGPFAGNRRTPSPVQGKMRGYSPARSFKAWLGLPRNTSGTMEGREGRSGKSLSVPDLMVCLEETGFPARKVQRSPLKLLQSANRKGSTIGAPLNQRLNQSTSESCLSSNGKERSPKLTGDVPRGKDATGSSQWKGRALEDSEREQNEAKGSGRDELKDGEKTERKLYDIANELLQTERAYVARLHLLDKVFCSRLTEEAGRGSFPPEVVKNIFSNISSIYSFHSEFLLPDLEDGISHWSDSPGLGNVLCKHAPFLRMYADYVRNFEQAVELVRTWTERSSAFRNIIQDIQSQEACGKLTLQHHMLEPVQRVPRYEMLFRDYLKKLPEDNPDYEIAQKSLQTISLAASHSNSAIHKAESLKQLLEIYEMVGEEEVINPTSEFLREGRLLKLAARNTSSMERHLFLFNNFLLCCTPKFSLVGQRFTVRCRIGVDGMHVQQTTNEDHAHSFQVSGKERTLELQASSERDRDDWIEIIQKAVDVFHKKNETFKSAPKEENPDDPVKLGRRAPRWIRDNQVTVCMKCREPFNALTRRRHHCRACGCVVCWKCSDHKVPLEYDGNKLNKVCKSCYTVLTGGRGEGKRRRTRELEMSPESSVGVMSGFLLYSADPQTRREVWCSVSRTEPLALRLYAAPQDVRPLSCIPLLGCSVKDSPPEHQDHLCFRLSRSQTAHTFSCDSLELKRGWVAALKAAAAGRLPGSALGGYDSTTNGSGAVYDDATDEGVSSDEEFTIVGGVASRS
ncbi:FYVE, RhoGEF and PH domain-containing protein 4-like [Brachionichthys hirsutus]|uniref:FYVE, RhoGEF and PH domain-containing protein 4-like n=1 Tax=Brachionichthys hirsutus TaxID=412623 RepID=UPI00360519A1